MFFIAYTFKGQVHVFARRVKIRPAGQVQNWTIFVNYARRPRDRGVYTIDQLVVELAAPNVYSLFQGLEDEFHCSPLLSSFSIFDLKACPQNDLTDYGRTEIRFLAEHYGRMIEDVFQGSRIEENPVFTENTIQWEFESYKHQIFILRQRTTQEELVNH